MRTSESIVKIAPAFLAAQKAITFATKDATNPHYKNKYADLPAVIDAIKPALNDAGIAYMQSPTPSDDGKFHLTTRLMHASGEWIEDTFVMPLAKQDPQAVGSAMTYARRYALAAITGLYQDDDDGNAGSGVGPKAQAPVKKGLTTHEMTDLKVALREADTLADLKRIGDEAYEKMTEEQRGEIAATYKKRKKEIEEGATA